MTIWYLIFVLIFNLLFTYFIEFYGDKRCHIKGCKSLSCKIYKDCPFSEYTKNNQIKK